MKMGRLMNPRREEFCRAYDMLISMNAGTPLEIGRRAYEMAGNAPNRANHNRWLRDPAVQARLIELRREREDRARAARMPIEDILFQLKRHGIERVADFFEPGADGLQRARDDLNGVPVEAAIALLKFLREAMRISAGNL
jgi:hypothetical protein